MPLVNAQDLLQHAYENQYAVAGIGISDFELAQASLESASLTRAPIILNLIADHQNSANIQALIPCLISLAQQADIPVAIHFDHATSPEVVHQAIRLGCNSVMFEPQSQNLLENQAQISSLRELCEPLGIALESVAGYVNDDNIFSAEMTPDHPTQPATAKYLATRAKPTALAVSVGNQHGLSSKAPKIDFARLKRIHQDTQCPLVIHGGSGLTEDQCIRLTRKGVSKINFFSELAKTQLDQRKKAKDYFASNQATQEALVEQLNGMMRLVGSAGRAAEILQQSRRWAPKSILISAQSLDWHADAVARIEHAFEEFKSAHPAVQKVSAFDGIAQTHDFSQRKAWLIQLNQQPGLDYLQTLDSFKSVINHLRSVATEVHFSQNA